jgi:hypothetical protein
MEVTAYPCEPKRSRAAAVTRSWVVEIVDVESYSRDSLYKRQTIERHE